ncbi:hypothetical protein [Paenibacillus sp. NPDC093718]|uniref:hypothetical protein n=1 Tax=Paenibacillus sp. NPDC093718 TaxID=3390601 RepID=UPI003CFC988C
MKELYDQYKTLLFTLAYQLTGSAADAEKVFQQVLRQFLDGYKNKHNGCIKRGYARLFVRFRCHKSGPYIVIYVQNVKGAEE